MCDVVHVLFLIFFYNFVYPPCIYMFNLTHHSPPYDDISHAKYKTNLS